MIRLQRIVKQELKYKIADEPEIEVFVEQPSISYAESSMKRSAVNIGRRGIQKLPQGSPPLHQDALSRQGHEAKASCKSISPQRVSATKKDLIFNRPNLEINVLKNSSAVYQNSAEKQKYQLNSPQQFQQPSIYQNLYKGHRSLTNQQQQPLHQQSNEKISLKNLTSFVSNLFKKPKKTIGLVIEKKMLN